MKDAPERIFASVDTPLAQMKRGTWHQSPYGTEYIRADVANAEIARLRAALDFYSCTDGCNGCADDERHLIGCGWIARAALGDTQ